MSLPADYHSHTPLCHHATGQPTELAAQAVRLGLKEMGFSDHSPMPRDDFDNWRLKAADLDKYAPAVEQARRDHPNLVIKLALEVDYLPGQEDWIRDLAARHPWDYFIGSVHYISDSWAIDNPAEIAQWKTREPMEVWTAYFERLTQAAESGLFDIIGLSASGALDTPAEIAEGNPREPMEVWTAYFERLTQAAESGLFDIIGHADLCKKFAIYRSEERRVGKECRSRWSP